MITFCQIKFSFSNNNLIIDLRDRMYGDFVSFLVCLLDCGIVGVLVGDEEGGFNIATVRVLPLAVEYVLVKFDVIVVDGVIKGDGDHLGDVLGRQVVRDAGAVLGAEAVREDADGGIAGRGSVGVVVVICNNINKLVHTLLQTCSLSAEPADSLWTRTVGQWLRHYDVIIDPPPL